MTAERENYRLICIKRGPSWQVEMRDGAFWSVGWFAPDLDEAIRLAREKFAADHPKLFAARPAKPAPAPASTTDLSDLFI